jgi:hypothetical protein
MREEVLAALSFTFFNSRSNIQTLREVPVSSRRNFIFTSAAAVTAAAFPKLLLAQRKGGEVFTPGSLGAYAQGILTQSNFEGLIGSVFTAFLDNDPVAYLSLQKVSAANTLPTPSPLMGIARPATIARPTPLASISSEPSSFQLIFNNGGAVFDQGTYLLDHGTLGSFACFLVPGMSSNGPTSCATFCYLSAADAVKPAPPITRMPGMNPGW